jgi:CheY-like chemotaxis protein
MAVRCLIVDDDEQFLRAARELLEADGITVVGAVSTGAQASRSCRRLQPDVALVDINLGTETGFDVARLLAVQSGTGRPQVILVSASAGDALADMIAESPAVSFLPKECLSGTAIRGILARVSSAATPSQRDSR